jgi:hypothetical protein
MRFCKEGVMGNNIQIVAGIIFNEDCLLYSYIHGKGVKKPKARASPCLCAETLRRANVSVV